MEHLKYPIVGVIALFFSLLPFAQSHKPTLTSAQKMERMLAPVLPKDLDGGGAMTSAKAEGEMLVVGVSLPNNAFTRDEMNRILAAGVCLNDRFDHFFQDGGKIRIDLSIDGTVEPGAVIDGCPASS